MRRGSRRRMWLTERLATGVRGRTSGPGLEAPGPGRREDVGLMPIRAGVPEGRSMMPER